MIAFSFKGRESISGANKNIKEEQQMIYNFPSLRSYDTGVLLLWYLLRKVSMSSIVDELRPIWRGLLRCWCSWASDLLLLPLLWEWCKTWRIIESVTRGCRCNEVWITKTKLHFFRHEYNSIPSNLNTSSQLFSLHYCCFKFPSFFISVISQLTTQKNSLQHKHIYFD